MNFHDSFALTSRIDTSAFLRRWPTLTRTGILAAFLLVDFLVIVAISWLTGVSYHLAVYEDAGEMILPWQG